MILRWAKQTVRCIEHWLPEAYCSGGPIWI